MPVDSDSSTYSHTLCFVIVDCDGTDTLCLNGTNRYSGTQCVPLNWVCDEEADCTDGSDEVCSSWCLFVYLSPRQAKIVH